MSSVPGRLLVLAAALSTFGMPGLTQAFDPQAAIRQLYFDETMARKLTEVCDNLSAAPVEHAGYLNSLTIRFAEAGLDMAELREQVPSAEDMAPFYEAFIARHGGNIFSSRPSFCRAGGREIEDGTGLGRMLKRTEE